MRTDVEKLAGRWERRDGHAAGGGRGDLQTEREGHVCAENLKFVTRTVAVTAEGEKVPLGCVKTTIVVDAAVETPTVVIYKLGADL